MGFGDKLKKAVFKDEPTSTAGAGGGSSLGNGSVMPSISPAPLSVFSQPFGQPFAGVTQVAPTVVASEVDPMFYGTLQSAMNSVPAPGLQELLVTMDGLAKANIPQNQQCQIGLSVVAAKGVTLVQVQAEIAKRLDILESENSKLTEAADRQCNVDVGGKETEIGSIDQKVNALQEQIKGLQERKLNLQSEVSTRRKEIDQKKTGLAAAYNKLKQETAFLQVRISG